MTNEAKTQWHPAFCSAVKLELIEDGEYLDYTSEYNLTSKPLQIDLLIVKKIKDVEIKNEIGKLFRKHNIIEYKSPDDSMNVSTFLKVISYACLCKTQEAYVDDIKLDEITITLVRERKPVKLFRWFRENGYQISEKYKGIYYIHKDGSFPTQVIVSNKLDKASQRWLTLLTSKLDKEDAKRIVSQVEILKNQNEKEYADSVLQVTMKENQQLFRRLKREDKNVCEALRELMAPELDEARQQGIEQGIRNTVIKSLRAGNSVEDIAKIMQIPLKDVKAIIKEMS